MRAWIVRNKDKNLEVWYGDNPPTRMSKLKEKGVGWWGDELFNVLAKNNSLGDGLNYNDEPREIMIEITSKETHISSRENLNKIITEMVESRRQLALLKINRSCSNCLNQFELGICSSCADELEARLDKLAI